MVALGLVQLLLALWKMLWKMLLKMLLKMLFEFLYASVSSPLFPRLFGMLFFPFPWLRLYWIFLAGISRLGFFNWLLRLGNPRGLLQFPARVWVL